jgi:hypothetical protein
MGHAYVPGIHWTSRLRSKAGYGLYESADIAQSTFTIEDTLGKFTELLVDRGYKPAGAWRKCPTYYIEVNTSEGDRHSSFCLDPHQVNKVSTCSDIFGLAFGLCRLPILYHC